MLSNTHFAVSVSLLSRQCRRYLAANGAIMRTSILGVLEFNSKHIWYDRLVLVFPSSGLARVVANTREVCLTTHADPRCLASCVAVTTAVRSFPIRQRERERDAHISSQIALMLQGKYNPQSKKDLEQLVSESLAVSLPFTHTHIPHTHTHTHSMEMRCWNTRIRRRN